MKKLMKKLREIKYRLRPVCGLTGNKLADAHRIKAYKLFWLRNTLSSDFREWTKEMERARYCEQHNKEPDEAFIDLWMEWFNSLEAKKQQYYWELATKGSIF